MRMAFDARMHYDYEKDNLIAKLVLSLEYHVIHDLSPKLIRG